MSEGLPTVTKDPHCHFPSTWRDAKGKLLTDRKIQQYQDTGFYDGIRRQPNPAPKPFCSRCGSRSDLKTQPSGLKFCAKCCATLQKKEWEKLLDNFL